MNAPDPIIGTIAATIASWLMADAVLRAVARPRRPDDRVPPRQRRSMHGDRQALRANRSFRRRSAPGPVVVAAWLDAVAASVRSGSSLRDAVVSQRSDDSFDDQMQPLHTALERGEQLAAAVVHWHEQLDPDGHLAVAAMALATAAEVGGAVTQPLERSAAILRQTAAADDERRSWSSQARLSAIVMTALPPAVLGLLIVSQSSAADALRTPLGASLVGLGIGLDLLGFWWMRTIVRRAVR